MRIMVLLALMLEMSVVATAQQTDYTALLRLCSQHEKEAMEHPQPFQFVERAQMDWGSETRAVIETTEGRVDRIVAFNDEPLFPDQQLKQQQRLNKLLNDAGALRDQISDQRDENKRRQLMAATLPEAFILEFSGTEADGKLRFFFTPDPKFSPKNRETQVFKGMRGFLWIDPTHERITAVRGELFKDVNFGWGILGRLHKGGRFEIEQRQVSPGNWRITTLNLDFKGRIFLLTQLRILRKENSTSFVKTPPDVTARAALMQLLSQSAAKLYPGK